MNPNNPDIDDLLKILNKKRNRNDPVINSKDVINDFKIISYEKLEDVFKGKTYSNRELTKTLNDLVYTFTTIKTGLEDDTITVPKDIDKSTFIAIATVQLQVIEDIKKQSLKDGRTFNISKYITEQKKSLCEKSKMYAVENPKKKRKIIVNEYEDDSDDGSSEEEDDGDDEEDDEDEDDDNYDECKFRTHNKMLNNKVGKEFIEQLYRGKGGPNEMEDETLKYFTTLNNTEKLDALSKLKEINDYQNVNKPILFQIMTLDLPLTQKNHILKNYITVATSKYENNKLKQWTDAVMQIPFGKHKGTNISSINPEKVKEFLDNLQKSMDSAVYGHDEAKRQIIQLMGQQIRNPIAKGNMLGIWGVAGNGKTSLIKDGIAKAMDKPFIFISLGGATDASFLEGHSYTYEGSIYGRIANGLITSKCMDPIIYFDELDKISKTPKGDEITNILVHLTDPVQNNHFRDKYFHGIDIDLSKATMIFSFNDPSNVNPILMDRITCVETKYLLVSQKIHISKNYLLPAMFKEMGFPEKAVVFSDEILKELISKYTHEGGIRKFKELLYNIIRELNLANLIKMKINNKDVTFPFTITNEDIKVILKNKREVELEKINTKPKCGIVNGLYASTSGTGGVLPIECVWIPSAQAMQVKATGSLEKVIKESTEVATSVAWNYLDYDIKEKFLEMWKDKPMGFHIHCPDGSTPKDGPSAGGALTLALYSLLTHRKIKNDVAMTGEVNLQGNITAIGGLEAKLEGAKKAGCKTVLIPQENIKDLDKIKERNPTLLDSTFKVFPVSKFDEIIKHALLLPEVTDTPFITSYYGKDNIDKLVI